MLDTAGEGGPDCGSVRLGAACDHDWRRRAALLADGAEDHPAGSGAVSLQTAPLSPS